MAGDVMLQAMVMSADPYLRSGLKPGACTVFPPHFSLVEIPILAGGANLPVPAVPASTRIYARMKRVRGHSSFVNILVAGGMVNTYAPRG